MRIHFLIGLSALVLLSAGRAAARQNRWEVSPEAGYLFGGTIISDRDETGKSIGGGPENAGVYGLRVAYLATQNFEFDLQAARTDARVSLNESSTQNLFPFRTDYLIGSGAYRFKIGDRADSIGHVNVGAGAGRLDPGHGVATTRLTGFAGVGFERFLYSGLGFRLDGNAYATRIRGAPLGFGCTVLVPSGDGPGTSRPCSQKSWLFNSDVTAGLVLGF